MKFASMFCLQKKGAAYVLLAQSGHCAHLDFSFFGSNFYLFIKDPFLVLNSQKFFFIFDSTKFAQGLKFAWNFRISAEQGQACARKLKSGYQVCKLQSSRKLQALSQTTTSATVARLARLSVLKNADALI